MKLLAKHDDGDEVAFGAAGPRDKRALLTYAASIAAALGEPTADARVVLACEDRYRFAAALLAVWSRGASAVLPANAQPASLRSLLGSRTSSGASTRSGPTLLRDRDDDIGLDVRALEAPAGARPVALDFPAERVAAVLYTSGSSGQPLAHAKTFSQLLEESTTLISFFELERRAVLAAVPPHHIYGLLFGVLVPLLAGGRLSRSAPLQPSEVVHQAREHGADVLVAVPPHLAALAAFDDGPLPAFARVFSSGAPLPEATDGSLRQRGLVITQVLGSTETGGVAARTSTAEPWQALPRVELQVAADGALAVRSPWASASGQGFQPMGDRVERCEGGFRHLGRGDDVVKIAGRRIDLSEITARIAALPHVREARVVARPKSGLRGMELCAVVAGDVTRLQPHDLRRALVEHLDPVTVPRRYRVLRALPRDERGKVSRAALLALFSTWEVPVAAAADPLQVSIPEDLGYFNGHFDGLPILPGVVQLDAIALAQARRRWPDLGPLARLTRVKFKRTIAPGEQLSLSLVRRSGSLVEFALDSSEGLASSGRLHFREVLR